MRTITTRSLLLLTLLLPFGLQAAFPDVSTSSPYYEGIEHLQSEGVVEGNPDGNYAPNDSITRAAFVKIVIGAEYGADEIAACDVSALQFSDVTESAWYAPYVCIASNKKIVQGYDDGTFKPGNNINVAEAAKIIVAQHTGPMAGSPWYRPYVEHLSTVNALPVQIASLNGKLNRGQMAEVLFRLKTNTTEKPSTTYEKLMMNDNPSMTDTSSNANQSDITPLATFAGGCFWCMEPPYQENPNVEDAVVGYAGGSAETANYSQVGRGQTEHREAVQVTFDPAKISYEELVEIFWQQIDPTDAGGQFADRGFHYTTAIYYHDDMQKQIAEASKKALADSGKFDDPIVTEILPYSTFFPAEEYHQEYYKKSSEHYERYKKGSGRAGFIEENWAKVAALEAADAELAGSYQLSEAEIEARRKELDALSYKVIAKEGTEPPFENDYWDNKEPGIYVDKISGEPLYASVHKFDSGTGWPSFWRTIDDMFVTEHSDWKLFYRRTEVRSRFADSHLGHIFNDGPDEHGGIRHCINSAALRFVHKDDMAAEGYGQYLKLFGEE